MTRSQAMFDCAKDLFVDAKSDRRSSAILLLAASPTGSPSWRTGPRAPGCTCRRRPGALLSGAPAFLDDRAQPPSAHRCLATSDWLQWLQRITMSEGTGPRSEQRHCADADGDHRFGYDEEPQSCQKHEEAA